MIDNNEVLYSPTLKKEADAGNMEAQFDLGVCYELGSNIRKSDRLAAKYYKMAADQGHVDAQFNLALCYENGVGVVCST